MDVQYKGLIFSLVSGLVVCVISVSCAAFIGVTGVWDVPVKDMVRLGLSFGLGLSIGFDVTLGVIAVSYYKILGLIFIIESGILAQEGIFLGLAGGLLIGINLCLKSYVLRRLRKQWSNKDIFYALTV